MRPHGTRGGRLVEVRSDESSFQAWWLFLLVFGPLGIVAIVLLSALSRPARTTGLTPMSHQALADQNRLVAIGNWAWAIPLIALLSGGPQRSSGRPRELSRFGPPRIAR